jgi:hypothetical protein
MHCDKCDHSLDAWVETFAVFLRWLYFCIALPLGELYMYHLVHNKSNCHHWYHRIEL